MKTPDSPREPSLFGNCVICAIFVTLAIVAIVAMVSFPGENF